MKIYTLMENTALQDCFSCEHGLSLYIETQNHKILFDTGKTNAFAQNATTLGIDLSEVDLAILSHGHYDHGGGLKHFLEVNQTAKVYINENAFSEQFDGHEYYIGIDQDLKNNPRIIFTNDNFKIDEELSLCTCNDKTGKYPLDSAGLCVKKGDIFEDEKFLHEQYLTICENGCKILISGCSHKGILNIMHWLSPDILVGGFHFMNVELENGKSAFLDNCSKILQSYNTTYYTCHCTGLEQYDYLKSQMGDKLNYIKAGQINEI